MVANMLGIGVSTVYKLLKTHRSALGENAGKDASGQWVTPAGIENIRELAGLPENVSVAAPESPGVSESPRETPRKDDSMHELVASLAETNRVLRSLVESQAEERRRSDHLIAGLLQEIRETRRDSARLALAPPVIATIAAAAPPFRPRIVRETEPAEERPTPLPQGLKGKIIAFFQPWRLRKAA